VKVEFTIDVLDDDVYKVSRIKQFGHIWMEKLQETLGKNLGLRETARIMNCDPKTIIKYSNIEDEARKYQVCKVKIAPPKVEEVINKQRKDSRNKYMRVNWRARDKIILAEVKRAYVEVLKADKLTRVTKRQIALRTNYFGLIDDQLLKLPLTMNYINFVKEDNEAFKIRKAKVICREYVRKKSSFRPWEIYRKINSKEGDSRKIDEIINRYYAITKK
jgi:hypothetical protein